jgi:hypothetical protein
VPGASPIVRKVDTIVNEKTTEEVQQEIENLWKAIDKESRCPLEGPILNFLKSVEKTELEPDFHFRKAESCMVLLREINIRSKLGRGHDPFIDYEECVRIIKNNTSTEDPEKELELVVHELAKEDLIHKRADGNSPKGYCTISPKEHFFCKTDRLFQKWDPEQDAKKIVELLIKDKQDFALPEYVDKQFKWGPRRLNSAIAYLHLNELINCSIAMESGEYFFPRLELTEEAYFFTEND